MTLDELEWKRSFVFGGKCASFGSGYIIVHRTEEDNTFRIDQWGRPGWEYLDMDACTAQAVMNELLKENGRDG